MMRLAAIMFGAGLCASSAHADTSLFVVEDTLEARLTLEAAAVEAFHLPSIAIARPHIRREEPSGLHYACGWAMPYGVGAGGDFVPFYISYAPGAPFAFGLLGRIGFTDDVEDLCNAHGGLLEARRQ